MIGDGKDLFRSLFAEVSQHTFETYNQNCLRKLPTLLMSAARQSCPAVSECVGFEELRQCLSFPSGIAQTWRNPELYPYLNYIAFPRNNKRQLCINALRVHCDLEKLSHSTNPDAGYWRLPFRDRGHTIEVVRFDNETAVFQDNLGWGFVINKILIPVYRPHDRLFDDLEPRLYGSQYSEKSSADLDNLLRSAFCIISDYSRFLFENITSHINTISLLKEVNGRPISYSLRNKYIGAIFITITTPLEMAEQLIHEYYHQCLWPWWLVEPPNDLPDAEETVTSPITGAIRSLPTMIQAILIYASLLDFYTFARENGYIELDQRLKGRAANRIEAIKHKFNDLVSSVSQELESKPSSLAVVRKIVDLRNETLFS